MITRLLSFLTCLAAAPLSAQSMDDSTSIVQSCFMSAPVGASYPECLGRASNHCQMQPGGGSTMGMVTCIQAETAAWDVLLNNEYKTTQAANKQADALGQGAGISRVIALRDAQRAWIAFRDADCTARYALWQDGTIRSVVAANCVMTMTAARTIALRDMRGN